MYATATDLDKKIEMKINAHFYGSSYDPSVFGPPFWFILHNAAVTYSDFPTLKEKYDMKNLIVNMRLLIPCITCRNHYSLFVYNMDKDLCVQSRENLFAAFNDIHNFVNRRTRKQEMSLDDAKELYGFYTKNTLVKISYV